MTADVERRVSQLESYNEITELRSTYCWYAARGDVLPILTVARSFCPISRRASASRGWSSRWSSTTSSKSMATKHMAPAPWTRL
jgi:hypothetical protein